MSLAALFMVAKIWKQPQGQQWIKSMKRMGCSYYSATRKNATLPFETMWVGLEGIVQSEVSQNEKDKYCTVSRICGIYNSQIHRNREENGVTWGWG